jgi:hypothetical protein
MSYDPSHRRPPRQERWPSATPAGGWPSYRDAGAHRGGEQGRHRYEADGPGAAPAIRTWAGHQQAAGGPDNRGYSSPTATDTFAPAGNGYGYQAGDDCGYQAGNGYGYPVGDYPADRYPGSGRAGGGNGYAADDFAGTVNGYDGDGYDDGNNDAADRHDWDPDGYRTIADGYRTAADGFAAGPNDLGPGSHTEYNEHLSGDPRLVAPDAGVHPASWQAEQDRRRQARQRGMLVGAVTMILGMAVAIGVSTLAAGLLKAQTSPAAAVGSVFIDRTPTALRNALVRHFGPHGRTALLLGMYAVIAFTALVIGVTARRAAALGVAGIAAFTLVTAFVVITRPASHVADITPAVVGGIAGVVAVLWLVRAAAPTVPLRPVRGGARRGT